MLNFANTHAYTHSQDGAHIPQWRLCMQDSCAGHSLHSFTHCFSFFLPAPEGILVRCLVDNQEPCRDSVKDTLESGLLETHTHPHTHTHTHMLARINV